MTSHALKTTNAWVQEARADWALLLLRLAPLVHDLPPDTAQLLAGTTEALDALAINVAGHLGRDVL